MKEVLWHFVADPVEDKMLVSCYGSELELLQSPHRGEPFCYSRKRLETSGSRSRRSSWRYAGTNPRQEMGRELRSCLPSTVSATLARKTRVKIVSDSKQITDLPWECICSPEEDVQIVRSVPLRYAPPPLIARGSLRILALVSNPKDELSFDVGRELDNLRQAVAASDCSLTEATNLTIHQLQSALSGCHVLHFIGHGGITGDSGNLIFANEELATFWVDAVRLTRELPASVRLVCASAGFTAPNYDLRGLARFGQVPGDVALPSVVASQTQPPHDGQAVHAFWAAFYRELSRTFDLPTAMQRANLTAAALGDDWGGFVTIVRDNRGQPFRPAHAAQLGMVAPSSDDEIEHRLSRRLANELTSRRPAATIAIRDVQPPEVMAHTKLQGWDREPGQEAAELKTSRLADQALASLLPDDADEGNWQ